MPSATAWWYNSVSGAGDDIIRVDAEDLRVIVRDAFAAVGVPGDEATMAADVLWTGEMMGISTHGVRRVITYVQRIHDGAINPKPNVTTDTSSPSLSVLDGDNGLGPVVGSYGAKEAIRRASETGIGFVSCRNSHHFGPVAPYALRAVEAGYVAFMGTNAQPVMAPWHGAKILHGNNPIAIAAPRRNGPPFILDIAQSVVAYSKLRHAHEAGEDIPLGWAADSTGQPTTDAAAGLSGWVLPIGEHKGYGLALGVEILAAALSGGAVVNEVNALYRRDQQAQGVCHFFMVIDPDRLIGREAFLDRIDTMCALTTATPAVQAEQPVIIPGEPEAQTMADYAANGVPIPAERFEELRDMARGKPPRSMPDQ
ncbi:MAG: Ldh family oxidoreductase [Pseudomonadota bacterium]